MIMNEKSAAKGDAMAHLPRADIVNGSHVVKKPTNASRRVVERDANIEHGQMKIASKVPTNYADRRLGIVYTNRSRFWPGLARPCLVGA